MPITNNLPATSPLLLPAAFARGAPRFAPARPQPAANTAPLFKSYWLGGFEGSDHVHAGGELSLCEITQHEWNAAADYRRLAQFGIHAVRETAGWRSIERAGRYDFTPLARRARAGGRQRMQIAWTLCQYGWPADVDPMSAAFIERFARYARAAAAYLGDFADRAPVYTPVADISYLTWAAANRGWLQTTKGAVSPHQLKCQLVRAAIAACEAILEVDPRARFLTTDPLMHVVAPAGRDDLAAAARHQCELQFEAWDMLCGRTSPELGGRPRYLDVIGVNYYAGNQWELGSERALPWRLDDPRRVPLAQLLDTVHRRYVRPIVIAETGHVGVQRASWLREVAIETAAARQAGVPVEALCLHPILDRPDFNNTAHWYDCGLWRLERRADGVLERTLNTTYAAELRRLVRDYANCRDTRNRHFDAAPISPRSYS